MMQHRSDAARMGITICTLLVAGAAVPAVCGQAADYVPPELAGVGITEHPDARLPLEQEFVDQNGRPVRLGDYFDGRRPVLLTLNYYRCPMLCTLQLNGLVDALREMSWTPGQQFVFLTVSFDPGETPALAKAKQQNYVAEYGRPSAAQGWHFLTGRQQSITALTEATGFGYKWNPERGEWMHVAAAIVCTPDGRISRYLYGVQYDADTLRLSLVEAAAGRIGSTLDKIILYCYHYDAGSGRYGLAALRIMRLGGGLTVVALGTALVTVWLRDARRGRARLSGADMTGGQ